MSFQNVYNQKYHIYIYIKDFIFKPNIFIILIYVSHIYDNLGRSSDVSNGHRNARIIDKNKTPKSNKQKTISSNIVDPILKKYEVGFATTPPFQYI